MPSTKKLYSFCMVVAVTFSFLFTLENLHRQEKTERLALRSGITPDVMNWLEHSKENVYNTEKTIQHEETENSENSEKSLLPDTNEIMKMIRGIQDKIVTIHPSVSSINVPCTDKSSVNGIENLLCMTPPKFQPEYKNPCWHTEKHQFHCLPYFQLIGAPKSASTDLFGKITSHPDILGNTGIREKETCWWSLTRYGMGFQGTLDFIRETFYQYLLYFRKASVIIKNGAPRGYITGDGSPFDLMQNTGWQLIPQNKGLEEPRFINAHLIKHMNPEVKLVVILRNPVERLYSDYRWRAQNFSTMDDFHEGVVMGIQHLYRCTRVASLRHCLYSTEMYVSLLALKVRIHWGFYVIFLQDWFGVFPREQFHIIRTEDYKVDMAKELSRVYKFLGAR